MIVEESNEMSKGRSKQVKQATLARDNYACRMCGSGFFLTNHHIIPISEKAGKDELDNCIILDRKCHDEIHALYDMGVVTPANCVEYINAQYQMRAGNHV